MVAQIGEGLFCDLAVKDMPINNIHTYARLGTMVEQHLKTRARLLLAFKRQIKTIVDNQVIFL